jgi:flagellar basal-body rod protein FlgF/flagellar basal-body rod protein FlgG
MDSGLYAAYTALLSRTNQLDLAANNLANVSTAGYHAERASFQGLLAEASDALPSQVGGAVNNYSMLMGRNVSELQGALKPTGNPLDLAIQGQGYFAVKTGNGTRYTRDGEFTVSSAGLLQTKDGDAVLDASGNPIDVPTGAV